MQDQAIRDHIEVYCDWRDRLTNIDHQAYHDFLQPFAEIGKPIPTWMMGLMALYIIVQSIIWGVHFKPYYRMVIKKALTTECEDYRAFRLLYVLVRIFAIQHYVPFKSIIGLFTTDNVPTIEAEILKLQAEMYDKSSLSQDKRIQMAIMLTIMIHVVVVTNVTCFLGTLPFILYHPSFTLHKEVLFLEIDILVIHFRILLTFYIEVMKFWLENGHDFRMVMKMIECQLNTVLTGGLGVLDQCYLLFRCTLKHLFMIMFAPFFMTS